MMNSQLLDLDNFDYDLEGRWRFAFKHRLLRLAAAGFFITEGNRLNAADDIREGRIQEQTIDSIAMGRGHELYATLSDCACSKGILLSTNLIDDDDLRHM